MTGIIANLLPEALRVFVDPGHFVVQNRYLSGLDQLNVAQAQQELFDQLQPYLKKTEATKTAPIAEAVPTAEAIAEMEVAETDPLLRWGINVPYYGALALGAGTIVGNEQEKQAILERQRLMANRNYPMY